MRIIFLFVFIAVAFFSCENNNSHRETIDFNHSWFFHLGDLASGENQQLDHSGWQELSLPHDWSIEGDFSPQHAAGVGGGALPGGIGWYRKSFDLTEEQRGKLSFIEFDGVYRNSEVWINEHYLGKRPNGYISFGYELTPYLQDSGNVVAVKVDNSLQPNSRWYSGSGIYRDVRLVFTNPIHVPQWGTFITTPEVNHDFAKVRLAVKLQNQLTSTEKIILRTTIVESSGKKVADESIITDLSNSTANEFIQHFQIRDPRLWSIDQPQLYEAITTVEWNGTTVDRYTTTFGIRYFDFDAEKGFSLNGGQLKIRGVCLHHDLGSLGAAFNTRAMERQLNIMKDMGVNGIRTAHNPPAPQLLDLCDKMGFIVMDEAFDTWKMGKTKYGYANDWDQWHERDLQDLILRDRNHPSVFIWSVGNEILEQWDSTGQNIVTELVDIVKRLDTTRPVTAACNPPSPHNHVNKPMILDLVGYNYAHQSYEKHPQVFPGQPFIATETTSALATRDYYDQINNSDSIRRWPIRWDKPFTEGNPDHTVSSYDHVSTPWGSTHEETLKIIESHDFMSGMFIWTGFDYLGEPTPYGWPSRSSYFGVVDLAGFPKDAYYLYQSEWTNEPVLHIFPHWNWQKGDTVDVWSYFNSEEVELFLNGKSLGKKMKEEGEMKVFWRVPYEAGELKAVGYTDGKEVLQRSIFTAGEPAGIELSADRKILKADGTDLSFISVQIIDVDGNPVPDAGNLVQFEIIGEPLKITGVDNGDPTSHEPFQANYRRAFNGKCLVVVQSGKNKGEAKFQANSNGLQSASITINIK